MAKRLKIITNLVYIFIMLNLYNLSFTIGNDRFAPLARTDVVRTGGRERAGEQHGRADKATLTGTTDTSEYYCAGSFAKPGFRPVPDECPYPDNNGKLHDNFMYKEWCEQTFDNGNYIYEAYKDIAFNIEYTPEQAKTDIWQTPFETRRSKKGDCEDAVFLFFSHLPSEQRNAMIIWGWVIDKESRIDRAHVWYQLIDKAGQQYIAEGFSKEWNGIVPMEIVEETELRKPIFTITHSEVCRLASLTSKPDSWQVYQSLIDFCNSADFIEFYSNINTSQDIDTRHNIDYEFIGYLLNAQGKSYKDTMPGSYPTGYKTSPFVSKEISNIFKKLHELFTRCESQREIFGSNLQIAYRSIDNNSSKRDLNCSR